MEDSIDLYRCLDMVAPEMKTLLVLKYFEERSFKEIGGDFFVAGEYGKNQDLPGIKTAAG